MHRCIVVIVFKKYSLSVNFEALFSIKPSWKSASTILK